MLNVRFYPQSKRFLKKLLKSDPKEAKGIAEGINELCNDPKPSTATNLVNHTKFLRVRYGKYRVVYYYNSEDLFIVLVNSRDTIYKELTKLKKEPPEGSY